MSARFLITDHAAATEAAAKLPAAARRWAIRTAMAMTPLRDLEDSDPPAAVLEAIAAVEAAQERVTRAKAELLLLLADTGASHRTIATAAGMHHSTVKKLVDHANAERNMSAAELKAEQDRIEGERLTAASRARQEREAEEESARQSAEIRARRGRDTG